jgi:DNA-binding NtrC family response regulator
VISVLSGSAKGRVLRLPGKVGATVTIGKARGNDLVIDDPTVSRRHLSVRRGETGLEVRDLESTNGVFVGTTRIREALIEPGTRLRAGDEELLVGVELGNVVIPPSAHDRFGLALGESLAMRRIFGVLERIAPTSASVLLTGETGTGKDVLARSIHLQSKREAGPFEVIDCGAVTGSLIESELFGHERGAFTGAVSARAGAFERAAGGTLFLDEIGELALDLQPKLLRVLEAREFRRVGGEKTLAADVRVVAATMRDLPREVARGNFREDLYFRLAVVPIHVPPLRERPEDIPGLVTPLLAAAGSELSVSPEAFAALRAYDWPGNVRELRNVIERAVHFSCAAGSDALVLAHFPPPAAPVDGEGRQDDLSRAAFDDSESYRETRARFEAAFERRYVRWLLDRYQGNISAAARSARMDRNHLTDLARRHGLDRRR